MHSKSKEFLLSSSDLCIEIHARHCVGAKEFSRVFFSGWQPNNFHFALVCPLLSRTYGQTGLKTEDGMSRKKRGKKLLETDQERVFFPFIQIFDFFAWVKHRVEYKKLLWNFRHPFLHSSRAVLHALQRPQPNRQRDDCFTLLLTCAAMRGWQKIQKKSIVIDYSSHTMAKKRDFWVIKLHAICRDEEWSELNQFLLSYVSVRRFEVLQVGLWTSKWWCLLLRRWRTPPSPHLKRRRCFLRMWISFERNRNQSANFNFISTSVDETWDSFHLIAK